MEKEETETVLVEFEARAPPSELYCGFVRYRVREYMTKPIRCFKCQEFGHVANVCKRKMRCVRCGGEHEYGKCGKGMRVKCCNCGGNHSAAYWGCEVMKREVEVQQVRRKERLSYADAAKIAGQVKQSKESGYNKEQLAAKEKLDKKREWAKKKKLVTFIAGAINATAGIKSKTERIQVIVIAAVHHLGMEGLKWEEVRDELENSGQSSSGGGQSSSSSQEPA